MLSVLLRPSSAAGCDSLVDGGCDLGLLTLTQAATLLFSEWPEALMQERLSVLDRF
jgi:hypothetical protein